MKPDLTPSKPCELGARSDDALRGYYAEPAVRQRMVEFFGGDSLANATCEYITADNAVASCRVPRPVSALGDCLDHNLEIGRSLGDRSSLIVELDVEYVNFDNPAEAFQKPDRTFELQKPAMETALELLREYRIAALHVLSGRGHHFVWRIERESEVFGRLVQAGRGKRALLRGEGRPHLADDESFSDEMEAAHIGLGLVVEFFAHRLKELAASKCAIPVELTAIEVGPRFRDREMISIDISEYGDPLESRTLRVPFSVYHKPSQQQWLVADEPLRESPPLFFIPLQDIDVKMGLSMRCDPVRVASFARLVCTAIPEQTEGTANLLNDYTSSALAEFHRWFYSQAQHPALLWPETYDRPPGKSSQGAPAP